MMEEICAFMKNLISVDAATFDSKVWEEDLITQVDIEGLMGVMNFFSDLQNLKSRPSHFQLFW